MAIKGFVFDMDGILLDTESICDKTWQIAAAEYGLSEQKSLELINKCRGTNKNGTISILEAEFGEKFDAEKFIERTSELFHEVEYTDGIKVMKGVFETLDYLKKAGYKIALASSTRGPTVLRQLTNAGLISYFENRVTGDMVKESKPAPEIYEKACRLLELSPSECIGVEDSPNGLKSAKTAGLKTIMVPDRIAPDENILQLVDYLFESLFDIKSHF